MKHIADGYVFSTLYDQAHAAYDQAHTGRKAVSHLGSVVCLSFPQKNESDIYGMVYG
jgi:hypothetical protein